MARVRRLDYLLNAKERHWDLNREVKEGDLYI